MKASKQFLLVEQPSLKVLSVYSDYTEKAVRDMAARNCAKPEGVHCYGLYTAEELYEIRRSRAEVSMLGLAIVRKSLDPQWNRFACIFPGDKPTEWFISEAEARAVADKFNGVKK